MININTVSKWVIIIHSIFFFVACSDGDIAPLSLTDNSNNSSSSGNSSSSAIQIIHSNISSFTTTDNTFTYETDNLFTKVINAGPNAQACNEFEIDGRPSTLNNFCNDPNNWVDARSTQWHYNTYTDEWTQSHILFNHSFLAPGNYRSYWKNLETGQQAATTFTILINDSTDLSTVQMVSSLSEFGSSISQFTTADTMYLRVYNAGPEAQSCVEYKTSANESFDGRCSDLNQWSNMAGSDWTYSPHAKMWTKINALTNHPYIRAGFYKMFWRNPNTGSQDSIFVSVQ